MAFPTGWARKAKITIPDAQISGNNSNFPVLLTEVNFPIEMLDAGVNSALNGGGDVRFSEDSAGTIQLDLEVASFVTGVTPDVELWVKLPTLNTGAEKDIWVWYKKAAEMQPAVTAAFGRNAVWSDLESVMHLNDSASTSANHYVDSTGTQNGTAFNSPLLGTGKIGGSFDNGVSTYLNTGWVPHDNSRVSFWYKTTSGSSLQFPGVFESGKRYYMGPGGSNKIRYGLGAGSDLGTISIPINTWFKLDIVITGGTVKGFVNGVLDVSVSRSFQALTTPFWLTRQNNSGTPDTDALGDTDEWRAGLNVSDDWITTEYNNQSSPSTFASAGTPEAAGGSTALTIQSAMSSLASDNITLSQVHNLNPTETIHSITSRNVVMGLGISISIQDAEHGVSSDVAVLSQIQSLTVSSWPHSHVVDSLLISQSQTLAVAGNLHNVGSDSLTLFQRHELTIASGMQAVASDDVALAQLQWLVIQNATLGLSSDVAGLFDPTTLTSNPDRTHISARASRTSTPTSGDNTTLPTNNRTLRI